MTGLDELTQFTVFFSSLFLMMVGLIFTVIPPLPGTVIIWASAIGYGWVLGWDKLGWLTFGLLTLLMIIGVVADTLGGQFGAKLGGASCLAIFIGTIVGFMLGIIAGLVATPIAGCLAGIFGTLGGILLVEWLRYGNWSTAVDATKGYLAGTTAGVLAKAVTGCFMIGIFLLRTLGLG